MQILFFFIELENGQKENIQTCFIFDLNYNHNNNSIKYLLELILSELNYEYKNISYKAKIYSPDNTIINYDSKLENYSITKKENNNNNKYINNINSLYYLLLLFLILII